jgi:hypothetical protein
MMTTAVVVVVATTPNLVVVQVHADKDKVYCAPLNTSTACVQDSNQGIKQSFEINGLDCHNIKQYCEVVNNVESCSKL